MRDFKKKSEHRKRVQLKIIHQPNAEAGSNRRAFPAVPEILWSPLTAGVLTLASGFIGLAAHQMWLFPSVAPTAYLHAVNPHLPTARFYNTVVGHFIAIVSSLFSVSILGASHLPSVVSHHQLVPGRIWASGLAILLTLLLQIPLKALHPPSAATALLITLGAFNPTWADARNIIIAILITAALGEAFRRIRLAQPGQK
jgi:CBS-domain-containing membrane protein